jgi:hypothetical protein
MQIRTAILVAGTALAIAAPTATAGTAYRWDNSTYSWVAVAQTNGGTSSATTTVNGVKQPKTNRVTKTKRPTYPVTMIVEPMLPASSVAPAPDPNACESSMVDCNDEQLCELWGANCDLWAADVAAQAAAASEQQPQSADGQSSN